MKSVNELARLLQRAFDEENADVVPDGWLTSVGWQKKLKLTFTKWHRRREAAIKTGLLEAKKFKIKTQRGYHPIVHYRFTP